VNFVQFIITLIIIGVVVAALSSPERVPSEPYDPTDVLRRPPPPPPADPDAPVQRAPRNERWS